MVRYDYDLRVVPDSELLKLIEPLAECDISSGIHMIVRHCVVIINAHRPAIQSESSGVCTVVGSVVDAFGRHVQRFLKNCRFVGSIIREHNEIAFISRCVSKAWKRGEN